MELSGNVKKIKNVYSIEEYTSVKLSIYSPKIEKQFKPFTKEGILRVIITKNTSCLYFKLFELLEFHKVFKIELFLNINDGYTVSDNNCISSCPGI